MKLLTAFDIKPGDLVAFVGGGGKTTAMFRLAEEIVAGGGRVVTTTTTRIFAAQVALAPAHVAAGEAGLDGAGRAAAEAALAQHGHVLVTGAVDDTEGKALSVKPELVEALRGLPGKPTVLIEADGSRMRPFKAPAEHEPVIPPGTTLVVPVVGVDVLGAPLGPERVHRPALVAAIGGWQEGAPVTPELVARVLTHAEGGLKGVPPGARVVPLLNKVETDEALAGARAMAAQLLGAACIESVAIGAVRGQGREPVREVWGRVGAVVLAAGRSTRMGQPKPMLPWEAGQTLLGAVLAALRASPVDEIVVVTGMAAQEVAASLAPLMAEAGAAVRLAHNPHYATTEMARSLQVGLDHLSPGIGAALVALADLPGLEPAVAAQVVQRWRETRAAVVAPFHQGQRGHPLLFDQSAWPAIRALPPSANPREVVREVGTLERVEAGSAAILADIDTPEDYARARQGLKR
jgi:molybdenum cofactor cytidylyltransferase